MNPGRMHSVMTHRFSQVPHADIQRSKFNRSCGVKTTFDAGWLVPIFVDEALPGDTFNLKMSAFARLATPIRPFMDNLFMDFFWFAVPNRLVWDNWQKFNGEQRNPSDSTDYLVPQVLAPAGGWPIGSLSDYFGIPTRVDNLSHSSLWHRAYNLIWNEWFRDQNLQTSVPNPVGDGPDNAADFVLKRRGKRHDYFTSCLPWPQKGPAVTLPLGGFAPVVSDGTFPTFRPVDNTGVVSNRFYGSSSTGSSGSVYYARGGFEADVNLYATSGSTPQTNPGYEGKNLKFVRSGLHTDLSLATAATVNQLRQAFQIQRLYERDARGGTRYTEIILSHFGVHSPDARLQRPEYLGGGSFPVHVSPIAQTSSTDSITPQGNLAAIGTASVHGNGFVKSFTEHCLIIGLVSVRADLNYQQGLNRMFSRRTRWDYYWPALAHIGEQAVLNKEIFANGTDDDDMVFGYQERYAEYRYKPSIITGKFRTSDPGTLDIWHLAQNFASIPYLNSQFIEENPPVARVIAVPTEPQFLFDGFCKLICARPMPVYSVPGLIDHF